MDRYRTEPKTYIAGRAALAVALVLLLSLQAAQAWCSSLDVSARAALVMDADTGDIIISKNIGKKLPPASTTKVMTAILALENLRMDNTLKVSRLAASREPSKVNLRAGDEATVEALLYSLLIKSANDAATVLAEGMSGTERRFTEMMNRKAGAIGAVNTRFRTANGLPAKGQYTTVYDLALILRYALDVPGFVDIASTRYATLHLGEGKDLALKNSNKLLWTYEGAVAGKTGYTRNARDCYVGLAACGGRRLIVSILGSEVRWEDATKLLDLGFELSARGETLALEDAGPQRRSKPTRAAANKRRRRTAGSD